MTDSADSLRQRIAELEQITRLAESLGSAAGVDDILARIVEASLQLCRARRVAILLFSPLSKEILRTLVRSAEPSDMNIDHGLNLVVAGWIEHHGTPLLTSDVIRELQLKNPSEHW
jgi:hypothetical protein